MTSKYRHSTEPTENRQLSYMVRQNTAPIGLGRSGSRGSATWSWGAKPAAQVGGQARHHGGGEILEPPKWMKRNMSTARLDVQTKELSDYLKEQRQKERKQRHLELKQKRKAARRLSRAKTPGADVDDDTDEDDDITPYARFRRAARVVRLMIHTCRVCKESLVYSLMDESWVQMLDTLVQEAELNISTHGKKSFVGYLANENHELEQLEFDKAEFKKDFNKADDLLTDEIKEILQLRPDIRTKEQINDAVKCLKKINTEFCKLTLDHQKKIAACSFYDKFFQQRIILRSGLPPDGLYYVLSGSVMEKGNDITSPQKFLAGEKFGEEDMTCGCSRRATIVTEETTELLYLHKDDYMRIFDMAVDSTDPKSLDICKKDIVFSHYPMQKLIDNPNTWSVLKYKFGRLIVKNSHDMDSIYVIKSGEARVYKELRSAPVDVKARRKKIQALMEADNTYTQTRKLLDFVSERTYVQSHYRPTDYHPRVGLRSAPARLTNRTAKYSYSRFRNAINGTSLPAVNGDNSKTCIKSKNNNNDKVSNKNSQPGEERWMTRSKSFAEFGRNEISLEQCQSEEETWAKDDIVLDTKTESSDRNKSGRLSRIREIDEKRAVSSLSTRSIRTAKLPSLNSDQSGVLLQLKAKNRRKSPNSEPGYKKDPDRETRRVVFSRKKSKSFDEDSIYFGKDASVGQIPPFVQLESLHAGKVFGLRSCLPVEERGPCASLVSAGCEILQINKNFFCRHLDENLINLIKFKSKAYPSQEELIDRLDINLQWDEFKKDAMKSVLEECQIDVHKRWEEHGHSKD